MASPEVADPTPAELDALWAAQQAEPQAQATSSNQTGSQDLMSKVYTPTLEGLGMMGGTALGAEGAPETLGASVPAGSIAGYVAGEGLAHELDRLRGIQITNQSLSQQLWEGTKAEAIGQGIGAVSKPILGGVANLLDHFVPEAKEGMADLFSHFGITPTPAQLTNDPLLQRMETLLNRYPYTADNFNQFYQTQLAGADDARSMLLNKVGNNESTQAVADQMKQKIGAYLQNASPEDAAVLQDKFGDLDAYLKAPQAGQFGKGMLAAARKIALDSAGQQFDNLRAILPDDAPIPTPEFSSKAKEFLDEELNANPSDRNPGWVKRLSNYAGVQGVPGLDLSEAVTGSEASNLQKAIQEQMGSNEPVMNFASTQATMRRLRDLRIQNDPGYLRGIQGMGNTYAGYAAQLRQALSNDIEKGIQTASSGAAKMIGDPEAMAGLPAPIQANLSQISQAGDLYKAARANYASTKELMNDPYIVSLLKNDPEDFMSHAIQAGDVTNVAKLKGIIGDQNFLPVKQNLLANMLVNKEGDLSPSSFVNKVNKLGMPTLSTVFNPDELAEITRAQTVFKNLGLAEKMTGNKSETAGTLMAKGALLNMPATVMTGLMTGLFTKSPIAAMGAAAGELGTTYAFPKLLAKAYLSEPVRDLILHGVTVPASAISAMEILGRQLAIDEMQPSGNLQGMSTQSNGQGQ